MKLNAESDSFLELWMAPRIVAEVGRSLYCHICSMSSEHKILQQKVLQEATHF